MPADPSLTRDAALARMRRANRWLIAGAVAVTGVLTDVAAQAFPGRTIRARDNATITAQTDPARAHASHNRHRSATNPASHHALKPPAQPPAARAPQPPSAPAAPAAVVSGGS